MPSAPRSANFREVSVPAEAVLEATRAGDPVRGQRFTPVVPFLNQRLAHAEPVAADGGAAIGTHADLGKARDVMSQLLRFLARAALGREIFTQASLHALLRRYLSPRQNNLKRAALAADA